MTSNTLPAEQSSGGFWSDVRLALRGTSQDYTALGLDRAIFLLAVPMVLEMAMESLFAVVDAYFVASLGRDSVSVVGSASVADSIRRRWCSGIGLCGCSVSWP